MKNDDTLSSIFKHCVLLYSIISSSSTCNTSFILFDVFSYYPSVQSFLQLVYSVSETLIGVTRPRSVLTIVTLFFSFTDFHRITHVSKDTPVFSSVAPKPKNAEKTSCGIQYTGKITTSAVKCYC